MAGKAAVAPGAALPAQPVLEGTTLIQEAACVHGAHPERGWDAGPGTCTAELVDSSVGKALRERLEGFFLWFLAVGLDAQLPAHLPLYIAGLLFWERVACWCKWMSTMV